MPHSTVSAADNVGLSLVTGVLGFMANNWMQIGLFIFAAVHVLIAIDKWRYERSLRVKDAKL